MVESYARFRSESIPQEWCTAVGSAMESENDAGVDHATARAQIEKRLGQRRWRGLPSPQGRYSRVRHAAEGGRWSWRTPPTHLCLYLTGCCNHPRGYSIQPG